MLYQSHKNKSKGAVPIGVKIGVLAVLVIAGIIYSVFTYKSYTKGLPPTRENDTQRPAPEFRRPQRPRDFRQIRELMVKELNLTDEQQKKLQEIWAKGPPQSPEEMRERIEKSREILTPEQQEKARTTIRQRIQGRLQRRLERAREVLPPDQFEIFRKRLQDRINRWRPPGRPPGERPSQQPQQQMNNEQKA